MSTLTFFMTASNILMFVGALITPYIKKLLKSRKNTAASATRCMPSACCWALFGKSPVSFTIFLRYRLYGMVDRHTSDTANYSFSATMSSGSMGRMSVRF
jgi:hypothetical protein